MKKIVAGVLALLMCLSIGFVVFYNNATASDVDGTANVAEINGTGYSTLESAIDEAVSGDKITILSDITNIETLYIGGNKNITIDLNGKTVSTAYSDTANKKHYYVIVNDGILKIEDSIGNGKLSSRGIDNYGDLTVNGGTLESIDSGNGGAVVWNNPDASLTVNGGKFSVPNGQNDSTTKDGAQCLYNEGTAFITGGTFESNSTYVYTVISTGTITITPSEEKQVSVSGAKGGIGINSGTAVINGGSYSSSEYYGLYVSNDGSGEDPEQAIVTVNGGTFNGKKYSVWIGSDCNESVNSTIEITDGTFEKPINAESNTLENAIVVKGGTFSADVSGYLADNYKVANIDGKYKVLSNEDKEVEVTENILAIGNIEGEYIASYEVIGDKDFNKNSDIKFSPQVTSPDDVRTTDDGSTKTILEIYNATDAKKELDAKLTNKNVEQIPFDIDFLATDINGTQAYVEELNKAASFTLYMNESTLSKINDRPFKLYRIHEYVNDENEVIETEVEELNDAKLEGNALTFSSDKFSWYVLAVEKNTYTVSYTTVGDSKYGLPATVTGTLPDAATYAEGENVAVADALTTTETEASDGTKGTWSFSWNTENFEITDNTVITGTWKFTPDETVPTVESTEAPTTTPTTKPTEAQKTSAKSSASTTPKTSAASKSTAKSSDAINTSDPSNIALYGFITIIAVAVVGLVFFLKNRNNN